MGLRFVIQGLKQHGNKFKMPKRSPLKRYYVGGFDSQMSRAEAAMILGVRQSSSTKAIRKAHRKVMLANHPDNGGSDYLASKINEAKELLISEEAF